MELLRIVGMEDAEIGRAFVHGARVCVYDEDKVLAIYGDRVARENPGYTEQEVHEAAADLLADCMHAMKFLGEPPVIVEVNE